MFRKSLLVSFILLLLVTMMPAQSALAQKPEPPDLESFDGPPSTESMTESTREIAQKAASLQESLTPEQHAAVREILDKHQPEMQAVVDLLVSSPKPSPDVDPLSIAIDESIVPRMEALVESIETEMATVLDAEQMALYRDVTNGAFHRETGSEKAAMPENAAPQGGGGGGYGCTDYCLYAPTYEAYAEYFGYYGYLYAYYSYDYYGSSYAYNAMEYASDAFFNDHMALKYSGPVYFECSVGVPITWYYNDTAYTYWGYSYSWNGYYYAYYAYQYAYNDYAYTGSTYGYYSYIYNYYSYIYATYATVYADYCDSYW